MRTSRAEADSASGWNCVPIAHQSSCVLSIASITPSGQRAETWKPGGDVVDRLVVHAVDADFAVAIDPLHQRAEHDFQAVAMLRIVRILVRNGRRQLFRQMQKQRAALRDVEELHAGADAEHRHPSLGDLAHQHAVEILAAAIEQAHAAVQLIAVAARVEIAAADQHERSQHVEHAAQVVLVLDRRQDDAEFPGRLDRVVVAGAERS